MEQVSWAHQMKSGRLVSGCPREGRACKVFQRVLHSQEQADLKDPACKSLSDPTVGPPQVCSSRARVKGRNLHRKGCWQGFAFFFLLPFCRPLWKPDYAEPIASCHIKKTAFVYNSCDPSGPTEDSTPYQEASPLPFFFLCSASQFCYPEKETCRACLP